MKRLKDEVEKVKLQRKENMKIIQQEKEEEQLKKTYISQRVKMQ